MCRCDGGGKRKGGGEELWLARAFLRVKSAGARWKGAWRAEGRDKQGFEGGVGGVGQECVRGRGKTNAWHPARDEGFRGKKGASRPHAVCGAYNLQWRTQ
jgi:hypothetical protein